MRRRYANLWRRRLARKMGVVSKVEIRYPRSLPQVTTLEGYGHAEKARICRRKGLFYYLLLVAQLAYTCLSL